MIESTLLVKYVRRLVVALVRIGAEHRLRRRWMRATLGNVDVSGGASTGLAHCDVIIINLDHRVDRWQQVQHQLETIGVKSYRRFSAVRKEHGALGCALSHQQVLSRWDTSSGRMLMVCEDDCAFELDRCALDHLVEEFAADPRLNVLSLAYNARNSVPISATLSISSNTQTMSCYIVKPAAAAAMRAVAAESVRRLERGESDHTAAIDKVWKRIQRSLFFAIPRTRAAIQAPSFSDIERATMNYGV